MVWRGGRGLTKVLASDKDFAKQVEEILKTAPTYKGLTVQQIAQELNQPVSTTRVHMELLRAQGIAGEVKVGKSRLYTLLK
jgi:predicted transcriptional regulator